MARSLKNKKGKSASAYYKRHPNPVILHFQPTEFVEATSAPELREWERMVMRRVGLHGLTPIGDAEVSYTGTKCGTPGGIDPFDDCESD
jgi:hypothetical protein